MISNPKPNQRVQVHYNAKIAPHIPYYGKIGLARIICRGPGPRNHGIEIDGSIIAIPCGNLRPPAP